MGGLGELLEQVQEGRLGPVEVVEHGHQGAGGGQGLEQAADRPDGLLDRGRGRLEPDQLADPFGHQGPVGVRVDHRGQLGPGGRQGSPRPIPAARRTTSASGQKVLPLP